MCPGILDCILTFLDGLNLINVTDECQILWTHIIIIYVPKTLIDNNNKSKFWSKNKTLVANWLLTKIRTFQLIWTFPVTNWKKHRLWSWIRLILTPRWVITTTTPICGMMNFRWVIKHFKKLWQLLNRKIVWKHICKSEFDTWVTNCAEWNIFIKTKIKCLKKTTRKYKICV